MKINNIGILNDDNETYAYTFRSENELKDKKYSLYLYLEEINGHFYAKFGEAKKQTVFSRYSATGHTANKRMIALWQSDKNDKEIHAILRERAKNSLDFSHAEKDAINSNEAYEFYSINGLKNIIKIINTEVNSSALVKSFIPLYPDIDKLVNDIFNTKATKFNLDLCARWGKTRTALELMHRFNTKNIRISLMLSYIGTVRTSYINEINENSSYDNCMFIDPDYYATTTECTKAIETWLKVPEHYVLYYVALTGTFNENDVEIDCFKRRIAPLKKIINYSSMMFVEEADFGSSCNKQITKIQRLFNEMKCKKFFAMTGTNSVKSEYIWPKEKLEYFKKDYLVDVLTSNYRKNSVPIQWHILSNAGLCENFPEYNSAMMENFSDMVEVIANHMKEETYFEFLIKWLFNKDGLDPRKWREVRKTHPINLEYATMIFMPANNIAHIAMKALIEKTLGSEWLVKILDGNETSNAKAEKLAKDAIKDHGNKVIFLASGMANRSFSVPSIKNIVLLFNDGAYSSIVQKIARGLTPFKDKVVPCNIVDFRMNYSSMTNADRYLEEIGINAINDDIHTNKNNEVEVLKLMSATEKIIFDEYFYSNIYPIKTLSTEDLHVMMQTSNFNRSKGEFLITKKLDQIDSPRQCMINETFKFKLACTNVKGDSDKYEKHFKSAKIKADNDKISEREKADYDAKLQHFNFLWNHKERFNTYRFKTVFEEFRSMSNERIKAYENAFGIDMHVMSQIASMLNDNNVKFDF